MNDKELMQQALDALEHLQTDIEWQYKSPTRAMLRKIEKALRDRLAQPEPEPVAQVNYNERQNIAWLFGKQLPDGTLLYTAPPQREKEQEPVACVYKATTKAGETAHFGVHSAAKAWAKSGIVEEVPIRNFKVVQKPCDSCESLARAVMLDQVYHENITKQREWVGLTEDDLNFWGGELGLGELGKGVLRAVEDHLKKENA